MLKHGKNTQPKNPPAGRLTVLGITHPDLTTLLPMKKLLLNTNFDLMKKKKEKLGRLDESDKASEQPDVSSFIFNLMDSG